MSPTLSSTAESSSHPQQAPSTFRLVMDASASFPWPSNLAASRDASQSWARKSQLVSRALARLPSHEQAAVTRFFHAADASRCLSALYLKHLAIMRGASVPWSLSTIGQEREMRNGKPYYAPGGIDFNVSHHGNYVVGVGAREPGVNVGIDIVKVDLERDGPGVRREGFAGWVDMFADVLSEEEKGLAVRAERRGGVRAGLRQFHTLWACKEAYVKMTSDALMAPFLKDLAFPDLSVPEPTGSGGSEALWGAKVTTRATIGGQVVEGVKIELMSLGQDYIVATAVDHGAALPGFELVRVDAEASKLECCPEGADVLTFSLVS